MTTAIDLLNAPNTAPASNGGAGSSALNQALDQKAFLRLLTTQLTSQDPFNPVDNTQMIAQMAQFSQVAGITEMNQTLTGIAGTLGSGRLSDASAWIGRGMLVNSDIAAPLADGSYAGELTLPSAVDSMTVTFTDENGAIVHTVDVGAHGAGAAGFAWDGKNEAGQTVATGPLKISVTARSGADQVVASTATWTAIAGLQSPANGGEARLVTALGLLKPSDALRIA